MYLIRGAQNVPSITLQSMMRGMRRFPHQTSLRLLVDHETRYLVVERSPVIADQQRKSGQQAAWGRCNYVAAQRFIYRVLPT